jgi:hypothetical protein
VNEKAYTPEVISIGHFHYGDERLETVEKLKSDIFQEICAKDYAKREKSSKHYKE